PSVSLLERLHKRNEYLITSHHPLRETLISQTGFTELSRRNFLQDVYNCATLTLGGGKKWEPPRGGISVF
ncbi:MAG: HNH endonuclease, partial [Acinetobacter sp.]